MGKIKVNVKSTQQPQSQPQQQQDSELGGGFHHEPSAAAAPPRPEYGSYQHPNTTNHGRYYEPDSFARQPQQNANMRQRQSPYTSRQQPNNYNQRGQQYPSYQSMNGGYPADPFQQFFAPQYQQRKPQQQPQQQPQQKPRPPPRQSPPEVKEAHQATSDSDHNQSEQQEEMEVPITSQRHEGGLLQETGKQYSIASTQTFTKLDTIKGKFNDLLSKVSLIETTTNKEEAESLLKSKNLLAQISGDIDRLQFTGLDAIDTSVLHSGKDEARNTRKKINRDIEELQQHVQELHKIYGEIGIKIAQHEEENRSNHDDTSASSNEASSETSEINKSECEETQAVENQPTVAEEEVSEPTTPDDSIKGNSTSIEPIETEIKRDDNDKQEIEVKEELSEPPSQLIEEEEKEAEHHQDEPKEKEIEVEKTSTPEQSSEVILEEKKEETTPVVAEHNSADSVDMTDWVIEETTPSQNDDEIANLKKLLQEKDELIEQLRAQLLEKDKIIQHSQQPTVIPHAS